MTVPEIWKKITAARIEPSRDMNLESGGNETENQ